MATTVSTKSSSPIFDTTLSLTYHVYTAMKAHDVAAMYELKTICDKLHSGVPEYKGFKITNIRSLPSDALYEEMCRELTSSPTCQSLSSTLDKAIKTDSSSCKLLTSRGVVSSKPSIRKLTPHIPELWMGSIPKYQNIRKIDDAIIMPKFDGCSCGVKYVRNVDGIFEVEKATSRGISTAHKEQSSDITAKFLTICDSLTEALNNELQSTEPFTFNNGLILSNIRTITFRGEIVAANKDELTNAAAPYIAGKVNGGMKVWEEALDNITFIPFEIMDMIISDETSKRIHKSTEPKDDNDAKTKSETLKPAVHSLTSTISESYNQSISNKIQSNSIRGIHYSPRQIDTFNFFEHIGQLKFETFNDIALDDDDMSFESVKEYYHYFNESCQSPIDGVVYCSAEWTYPQTKEETTVTAYTKYAWKPCSEATTILRDVNYTIKRNGKIECILNYDPVVMNRKTYKQCKTVPTHLQKLYGIGIGSIITVELRDDIMPYVSSFESNDSVDENDDKVVQPYSFPTKCPFCDCDLEKTIKKDTVTIRCANLHCTEQLIQKYKYFMTQLGIKGIAEGKLRKTDELTLEEIIRKHMKGDCNKVVTALCKITARKFLLGVGFGIMSQITKATPTLSSNDLLVDNVEVIEKLLKDQYDDPFIADVMGFINEYCFENDDEGDGVDNDEGNEVNDEEGNDEEDA